MNDTTITTTTLKRKGGNRDGLFQRNGWWWIDFYDAEGKRHRKKAAPDYQTAKTIYRDTMTAIAKGEVLGIREEGIRLREFVEQKYWPTIKGTIGSAEQLRARGILDKQILPRFGAIKLSKFRREDIERWKADRLDQNCVRNSREGQEKKQRKVSRSTFNKELMRLKHLLGRAVHWGYLKDTPARAINKEKEPPGRIRYLSPEERTTLLENARPDLKSLISAALQTGGRRGEVCGLRWRDVDMRNRSVTFPQTKNGDRRVVPMTDSLRDLLQSLPRPLNPDELVFRGMTSDALTMAFSRLCKALGIDNCRFHDLRHDVASTLTMAGAPQRTVMEILGHRDPRMTLRYQHLAPGHIRQAMKALEHPGAQAEGTGSH